jgi:large subunit ribosomal protein L2
MGKNLRQQRRGKGTAVYKSPSHRYLGEIKYEKTASGKVVDIIDAPGRNAPVAIIDSNGKKIMNIAHEGMQLGQSISESAAPGNIIELGKIPEGSKIYNIEMHSGDGGRLCRSSGTFATLIAHEKGKSILLLSSREKKALPDNCRATIGVVASGGRIEKPFRTAGQHSLAMRALGKYYPNVKGVAKNAVDHPFGGSTRPGKQKTVSRDMPPGKKVGSISPKRTGKIKK